MSKQGRINRIYPDEPREVADSVVKDKLPVPRPMFLLGFKGEAVQKPSQVILDNLILNDLILDIMIGPSSELYSRLYEEGAY